MSQVFSSLPHYECNTIHMNMAQDNNLMKVSYFYNDSVVAAAINRPRDKTCRLPPLQILEIGLRSISLHLH